MLFQILTLQYLCLKAQRNSDAISVKETEVKSNLSSYQTGAIRVINILNNPIIFRTALVLIKNQKPISASILPTSCTLSEINFMGTITVHINAHSEVAFKMVQKTFTRFQNNPEFYDVVIYF